jgi:GNAT superfamily N-acetyltransferase
MSPERGGAESLHIRPATIDDHAAFVRLFPELRVDDPIPDAETWARTRVPGTLIAAEAGAVVGYCYFQELRDSGYVRNVVVDPHARRRGVGRALMDAVAATLRRHGKTSWRLNVKDDNVAALALYHRLGLRTAYASTMFRIPWASVAGLPAGTALVEEVACDHDDALERAFALPAGQLGAMRALGRVLLQAVRPVRGAEAAQSVVGLAVFDSGFPVSFPFRVKDLGALGPLLTEMHVRLPIEFMNVVVEDDERLAGVLAGAGALVRDKALHLHGPL